MNNSIKKIVVVGRDADAWLTALMLQLSFAKSGEAMKIQLIELPSQLHPQHCYTVLPSHKALHQMLGIDESSVLRAASGLYVLAQRFSEWSPSSSFMHAYDTHGINIGNLEFLQCWLKAQMNGLKVPLEDFSLGAVAAKQGRFVVLDGSAESFSKATYGYHLNSLSYLKFIAKAAIRSGLEHRTGEIKLVTVSDDAINSVILQDGAIIDGDLFIDASGEEALLIRNLESNNRESWQGWLPCDRILAASGPMLNPTPAFSQIAAFEAGWIGLFPLADRTGITASYSSEYASANHVVEKIQQRTGISVGAAVESNFSAGARKQHWIGNCVAIGSAGVTLDPLNATQLHILDIGLSLLRELFPVNKHDMKEAEIYNQKIYSQAANLRDFHVAHYQLNQRYGEQFWDRARSVKPPASLVDKIRLFESCGRIAMQENEVFQENSWASIFVGHGVLPKTYDPLVNNVPEEEQIKHFQKVLNYIASEVQTMPSLQAHLEMNAF